MEFVPLARKSTGMVVSISTKPSGYQMAHGSFLRRPDNPKLPLLAYYYLNLQDYWCKLYARWYGVDYHYLTLDSNGEDLKLLGQWIDEKKLSPIVGTREYFRDIDRVRAACQMVYKGKGGIGKVVFDFVKEE